MKYCNLFFSQNLWVRCCFLLLLATNSVGGSAQDLSHSDLSVYRSEAGVLEPIRSPEDWDQRRQQIVAEAEAAMGPLPTMENLPEFDVQISEDIYIGDVRRLTMTVAVEASDRLPLDLYLPKSIANRVDSENLFQFDSPAKLAAIVALHPTVRWESELSLAKVSLRDVNMVSNLRSGAMW